MRTARRILIVLLLAIGLLSLVLFATREKEPVYQGKTLSTWLTNYLASVVNVSPNSSTPEPWASANRAVVAMGTNAYPTLLRMLRAYDPPWKLKLLALAQKQHFLKVHPISADEKRRMASIAFLSLAGEYEFSLSPELRLPSAAHPPIPKINQDQADQLVPTLLDIYYNGRDLDSRFAAALVLGYFGPLSQAAIPALLNGATNTAHFELRSASIVALGRIRTNPGRVVPVLLDALGDANLLVRYGSVIALGDLPPDPKSAPLVVPALTELLSDIKFERQYVPGALANYALYAESALPALHHFLDTISPSQRGLRDSTIDAIQKIEKAAATTNNPPQTTNSPIPAK